MAVPPVHWLHRWRQRILLALYRILLKCRVGLGPVHICGICAPSLITLHKKIRAGYTNLQILHIIYRFYLMLAVCQFTESVLCNTHAVESVAVKDFLQLISSLSVKLRICIIIGIIDERQGYHIEAWIKCRIDQIGMHGDLYRVSVHQCLDSLGLISVCQLIRCVNVNLDLSSGSLFHEFTELTSSISRYLSLLWSMQSSRLSSGQFRSL